MSTPSSTGCRCGWAASTSSTTAGWPGIPTATRRIHALIDALLGAAGRGDIGEWFPSSDERWRGVRSTQMLRHVWTTLQAEGWRLENADLTIVAAEPRLAPYRLPMRAGHRRVRSASRVESHLAQSHDHRRPGRLRSSRGRAGLGGRAALEDG